jgi:hypothetical protein
MDDDLKGIEQLPDDVLEIVAEDAALRRSAQASAAQASNGRALSFCGFTLTGASAGLAAAFASVSAKVPDQETARIAALFAVGQLIAAGLALFSALPHRSSPPGSDPADWLPETWNGQPIDRHHALLEKVRYSQRSIDLARGHAKRKSVLQLLAALASLVAVVAAGIAIAPKLF